MLRTNCASMRADVDAGLVCSNRRIQNCDCALDSEGPGSLISSNRLGTEPIQSTGTAPRSARGGSLT